MRQPIFIKAAKRLALSLIVILALVTAFQNIRVVHAIPRLDVAPKYSTEIIGQKFNVSVTITGVTNLYTYQLTLSWKTAVLNFTNVYKGPFLSNNGEFNTFVINNTDQNLGTIDWAESRLGAQTPGADGDGTLVIFTFLVETTNTTAIDLSQTSLVNTTPAEMPHDVFDGYFSNLIPTAAFSYSPLNPNRTQAITFNATDSNTEGLNAILSYEWNFDDGNTTTVSVPTIIHVYESGGTYDVTLTVTDSYSLSDAANQIIEVGGPATSTISISASPTTLTFGETTKITGTITPSRPEATVTIQRGPKGGALTTNTTTTTNSTSQYEYVWTPTAAGNFTLKASWAGDASTLPAESSTVDIQVKKVATSLTLTLSKTTMNVDENVTISGAISPARANIQVAIRYKISGSGEHPLTTVTTNATGGFSYTWTIGESGTYEVIVYYAGDANTINSQSPTRSLTVRSITTGTPPEIIYGAVIAIIIVAAVVAIYFLKFRRRK